MRIRYALLCSFAVIVAACNQAPAPAPAPAPATPPAATTPASMTGPVAPPTTEAGMIASAISAAPSAVSDHAAIVAMDDKMQMRTLRPGTNGWTCMPDMPNTPGTDPMCLDKNGMDWAAAWMSHTDPPKDKMAIAYMLAGGSDASNTEPFAQKPAEGHAWIDTGPHMMVMNIGDRFAGYPVQADNTKVPYVMFANTPYAHLMIPVK